MHFGILLLLLLPPALRAQSTFGRAMKVQQLYESLKFEEAIKYGRKLLRSDIPFTKEQLLLIHQFTAYSFFNLAQPDSAKKHFVDMLAIDPHYQLDPVNTSPKIIRFFNAIKKEMKQNQLKYSIAYTKYVFIPDRRPSAAWRSAVFPGWGQYFKGQKKKAIGFAAAFSAAGTFTLIAAIMEKDYHQKYLDSTQPRTIGKNYDRYNNWYKTRKISFIVTGAIWLSSFADALWAPVHSENVTLSMSLQNTCRPLLGVNFYF